MYAIVKTGGKQVKVSKGDVLAIERLQDEVGSTITFDEILLLNDGKKTTIGTPLVSGAKVTAKVTEQKRDKKVIIFKKKRRQNYRRTKGHRQYLTVITVDNISVK